MKVPGYVISTPVSSFPKIVVEPTTVWGVDDDQTARAQLAIHIPHGGFRVTQMLKQLPHHDEIVPVVGQRSMSVSTLPTTTFTPCAAALRIHSSSN